VQHELPNSQRAREAMDRLYCCDCLEVLEKQRKQAVAVLLAFAQTIEE
jgi:hypothetical protein